MHLPGPGAVLGSGELAISKTKIPTFIEGLSMREIDKQQINMETYNQSDGNKDCIE